MTNDDEDRRGFLGYLRRRRRGWVVWALCLALSLLVFSFWYEVVFVIDLLQP